VEIFYVMM